MRGNGELIVHRVTIICIGALGGGEAHFGACGARLDGIEVTDPVDCMTCFVKAP
jgi:hypothetical protein